MDEINAEMKQAEKHITGMEKWCGLCVCPWNRTRKIRDDAVWNQKSDTGGAKGKAVKKQPAAPDNGQVTADGGPYIRRINNDAREDEMEDNMQTVGSMLGNLKSMAQDMGEEITKQNTQIDRIGNKARTAPYNFGFAPFNFYPTFSLIFV